MAKQSHLDRDLPKPADYSIVFSAIAWEKAVRSLLPERKGRILAVGDFMLSSAIISDDENIPDWEDLSEAVLGDLGLTAGQLDSRTRVIRNRNIQRYVFSLAYLDGQSVPGVTQANKTAYIFSESEFLRGVVQRHRPSNA